MSRNLKTLKVVVPHDGELLLPTITANQDGSIQWAPSDLNLRGCAGECARGEYL